MKLIVAEIIGYSQKYKIKYCLVNLMAAKTDKCIWTHTPWLSHQYLCQTSIKN